MSARHLSTWIAITYDSYCQLSPYSMGSQSPFSSEHRIITGNILAILQATRSLGVER